MRLSLILAAPMLVLLATGGVQAQAYTTFEAEDGQQCLVYEGVGSVQAAQAAAARGLPLCDDLNDTDDVDDSITGSIAPADRFGPPVSSVEQNDSTRN